MKSKVIYISGGLNCHELLTILKELSSVHSQALCRQL